MDHKCLHLIIAPLASKMWTIYIAIFRVCVITNFVHLLGYFPFLCLTLWSSALVGHPLEWKGQDSQHRHNHGYRLEQWQSESLKLKFSIRFFCTEPLFTSEISFRRNELYWHCWRSLSRTIRGPPESPLHDPFV